MILGDELVYRTMWREVERPYNPWLCRFIMVESFLEGNATNAATMTRTSHWIL